MQKKGEGLVQMNRRLLTILLISFVVAGACAFLVYRLVGNSLTSTNKQNTTPVVAAATDIKVGTVLSAANLTTIEIAGSLPQGALLKAESAIGRGVMSSLYRGEAILDDRLAPLGSGGGLAATIRKGMRACAVKVDEVVGVAGFVTPGMRVDVLITGNPPGQQNPIEGAEVRTLLQNIEVLSAGTDIQKDTEGKAKPVQVVNLLVSPEQAELLSLASNTVSSNQTHIQLVLRNPLDTQTVQMPGTAMNRLFSETSVTPPRPKTVASSTNAKKKVVLDKYSVEVFNGSQRSEQKVDVSEATQ
jgi:pilus assembly protein CpaB